MWVFCGGMYRAGSTLQFQITAELSEKFEIGKRIEWDNRYDFKTIKKKYANYQGLKIFKTHVCTKDIADEFKDNNAKGVYIFRDIRDVFVSVINKKSESFKELWERNFMAQCLDEFQKWVNMPRMLISKYEDVLKDLSLEVERIADHLEIRINQGDAKKIAETFSIEKQLDRIEKLQTIPDKPLFDPVSLLHNNHIRSGKIGQWQFDLSQKEVLLIEKKAETWMKQNGYELSNYKGSFFNKIFQILNHK